MGGDQARAQYGHGAARGPAIVSWRRRFTAAPSPPSRDRKPQGFKPGSSRWFSGFVRVPLNDLDAVRTLAEHNLTSRR